MDRHIYLAGVGWNPFARREGWVVYRRGQAYRPTGSPPAPHS